MARADNDGIGIAWERRPATDDTSTAPVVLVHGLGYARWGWDGLPQRLTEADLDLVLFDNRGIGDSDVPPGPYSAADMASDVIAVMDAAGVERAHVVGSSLGGMIAQEVALRWLLQNGCAVSARPTSNFGLGTSACAEGEACKAGLRARSQAFDWALTAAEMRELDAMTSPGGNPTLFSSLGCPDSFFATFKG